MVADGPKSTEEDEACKAVRKIFERKVDWDCQVEKVYSSTNLGLAKRVQTGLDPRFSKEKKAIILEDDTLPDTSFFGFCDELLENTRMTIGFPIFQDAISNREPATPITHIVFALYIVFGVGRHGQDPGSILTWK